MSPRTLRLLPACTLTLLLAGSLACSSAPTTSLTTLPGRYVLYSVDGTRPPVTYYPSWSAEPHNVVLAAGTADIIAGATADSLILALTLNTLDSLGQVTATTTVTTPMTFVTRPPDTVSFITPWPSDSALQRGTAVRLTLYTYLAPANGQAVTLRQVLVFLPQ